MKSFSIQTHLLFSTLTALIFVAGRANGTEFSFLVSNIRQNEDWCVTATNGVNSNFVDLGFRRCDFNAAPKNQLWRLGTDGKISSALDDTKCMVVNFGNDVFDGVRVRTTNCDSSSSNLRFTHNGGTDQLRLAGKSNYCLTNRGTSPNPSDTIHMKICGNGGRYIFTYRSQGSGPTPTPPTPTPPSPTPPSPSGFSYLATNGGCINVRDSNARNDQKLVLGKCSVPNQEWSVDSTARLIRTRLDSTKCMQAGRTAAPRTGTKMRIARCNGSNSLQQFTVKNVSTSGRFQLQLRNTQLCVDHRGDNANINTDPIILKPCDQAGRLELI